MRMGQSPEDGLDCWWNPKPTQRNAAYRAQQRAMRKHGRRQSQPKAQTQFWADSTPPPSTVRGLEPPSTVRGLEPGWVMVFNAGQHNEGVYTHTQNDDDGPTGSSVRTSVLAFEFADDASRFAHLLEGQGFHLATPLYWSASQLAAFCDTTGFEVSRVPGGTLPAPPSNTFEPQHRYMGAEDRGQLPGNDQYTAYRMWLEDLFPLRVENCGDDDCIIH
jgi:hypothetical protein